MTFKGGEFGNAAAGGEGMMKSSEVYNQIKHTNLDCGFEQNF